LRTWRRKNKFLPNLPKPLLAKERNRGRFFVKDGFSIIVPPLSKGRLGGVVEEYLSKTSLHPSLVRRAMEK